MISSLFIAHGAPNMIYDDNKYTQYLKDYSKSIPKPKGVIIFSAHWESNTQLIGTSSPYSMIYDFYGFEDKLYNEYYTANSNLDLANRIKNLLDSSNIKSKFDNKRGIDHGAWSVLKLMYPTIDIPVVTMSVNPYLSNSDQYDIGKALEPLKEEGILIIGSGGIVHNLREVDYYSNSVTPWAKEFNNWIQNTILDWNTDNLFNYENLAPNANLAVPRNEHFIPLLIAMGAGDNNKVPEHLIGAYQFGNLALDIWRFN
ncbi:DODA-type extradiol aromatic ring-opening family dioxygenase [Clostridium sp. 'White wine YQ']|uniref:DODA-type extradiol aromatic ring-opening family dioxygenase n=1 Tax=Clostridium sp. 'White wine YQ' TaxID=3027474 RepID=UPI002365D1E9|nr:class III extradiol ring-cleavage dioxygenase [Clostridium sp. 'White wine YQ']MDD7795217.1 class III extradiol ring-cleavage dioxygenase [Clostridium sp. 'White wine YQ']